MHKLTIQTAQEIANERNTTMYVIYGHSTYFHYHITDVTNSPDVIAVVLPKQITN